MADNILHSPGIEITETDKSFVPARPLIAGAAIVGPTPVGPAYAPTVCTSYGDYQRRFGTTFMMNRYADNYNEVKKDAEEHYEANEELAEAKSAAQETLAAAAPLYVRVETPAATEGEAPTVEYVEYTGQEDEVPTALYRYENDEYVLAADITAETIATAAAEVEDLGDSKEEYVNSQTAATKLQRKSQEYLTSLAAKSFFEQGGDSLLVVRVTDDKFTSGQATVQNQKGETAFVIKTISQGEDQNNWEGDPQDRTETTASIDGVIREDGSLVSGSKDNIRWEIADVDEETGTFSLYVRRGDDLDYDKAILEAFTNLSLDPDSSNYIARRIGDQHQVLREETIDDEKIYYIDVIGNYQNVSNYIYVEQVNDVYGYFLADGYTRRNEGESDDVANLLPKQYEGGFALAEGKLFTSEEDEANAKFFGDIRNDLDFSLDTGLKIQGIAPERYEPAIAILENQDEYEINMISAPGLVAANNAPQVDQLVSLASKRGDLIAVVDVVGFDAEFGEVKQAAMAVNSNYAATYWPWLQMYSSTGRLEWVPASVIIPGVYTFTDHVAAPWFAPAGMTRGSVQGVIQTERKLLKQHRDELYKKNVNPIAILPGNGITIYGQKTLQKKATALDRVNVRRLMIELKRTVKNMASGILFEQNTAALRNAFKGNLDNYLESVVQRSGLYGFQTIVEELNTPDVIDRNEFRCQIYVQPTKVIEFIYIDFVITNTGVEFRS